MGSIGDNVRGILENRIVIGIIILIVIRLIADIGYNLTAGI